MSVVVAVKDKENNSVWVGCDSQCSAGYQKITLTNKNNYKIFKPSKDENLIVGIVGAVRDSNILYCVDEYIDELTKLKDEVDFKYIVNKVIPNIQKILIKNKVIKVKDGIIDEMNNEIILAYKDKIFNIYYDFAVIESDDFAVTGSGTHFSTGNLSNEQNKSPKQRVIDAVKASCEHQLHVNYPIILMNTMTDEIEIIEK